MKLSQIASHGGSQVKVVSRNILVAAIFIVVAGLYVGFKLTPSSYAIVLKNDFHIEETGLIVGTPREIRSDEWAHFTPWTQAVVNNDFGQFNEYSPYRERFRTVYPMPTFDWGLFFKPYMWLYLAFPPDYAFSFYWFFMMAASVFGFYFLFRQVGIENKLSILASLTVFVSGFFQYWWTANSGVMAFAPWVAWAVLREGTVYLKFFLVFWFSLALIMALFYPPFLIQSAFLILVLAAAFSPKSINWKAVFATVAAGGIAVFLGVLYFWDEIVALASTVVPGDRRFNGGGMSFSQYLGHFFPTINVHRHTSLIGANICEISVVGSWLPIIALCFSDYALLRKKFLDEYWSRAFKVLVVGICVVSIWELLPLPSQLGQIFLWDRVHPGRMGFLSGLLWTVLALLILSSTQVTFTTKRFLIFGAIVCGAWYFGKIGRDIAWYNSLDDLSILIFVGVLYFMMRYRSYHLKASYLAVGAFLANLSAFGGFNPVQSAEPIFNRPATEVSKILDKMLQEQGGKSLAVPRSMGFPGAVLTGWGYPSVAHAMFAPNLDYWRAVFPEMDDEQIRKTFSRSGHIIIDTEVKVPTIRHSTVVAVPMARFVPIVPELRTLSQSLGPNRPLFSSDSNPKGYLEGVSVANNEVTLVGWAHWKGLHDGQRLVVLSNGAQYHSGRIRTIRRPDVAQYRGGLDYLDSGFEAKLRYGNDVDLSALRYCLVAEDGRDGEAFALNQVGIGFADCASLFVKEK